MPSRAPLHLLACGHAQDLATGVAHHLGVEVSASHDIWFACGEAKHVIDTNIRGGDVYVFQRPAVPSDPRTIYDRWMMALHAADAARCADADRVTLVLPYLPGARQDKRKDHEREGVSTGLFARFIEAAGVSMLITMHPHNEAITGCFNPGRTVLEPVWLHRPFAAWIAEQGVRPDVVASTDLGGLEMARKFANALGSDLAALSKERDYSRPNTVAHTQVIGEVAGRSVLVIDDILDTGGSMCSAVEALWAAGAASIAVGAVHALLSGPATERLDLMAAKALDRGVHFQVFGTSSVQHPQPRPWYRSFAIDPLLAEVVRSINQRGSVRALE